MKYEKGSTPQKVGRELTLLSEYIIAILSTVLVTAVSFAIQPVTGHAAVALLYLLLVVIAGLRLRRGPVLFVAASSALLWDYLINPPYFSFFATNFEDMMFFIMFFVIAIAMGHLTSQIRLNEITERMREQRTAALYELVQQAGLTPNLDNGLRAAVGLIETIFGVRAALILCRPDHTLRAETHPASSFSLDEKEYATALWAFSHRTPAGKFSDSLSESAAMHLPLRARTATLGILSIIPPPAKTFDLAERELLEAFAVLIGTILEKDHMLQSLKHAEILEASERLQRALLQSVSHELKTPLSAVRTGVDALAKRVGSDERSQMTLEEIRQALRRLHRVIDNLLDMTRIESGVIHPRLDWCDTEELIQAAIDLAADGIGANSLAVETDEALPIVKLDQALLEQSLCNLLLNAASNSPLGTKITIRARVADNWLLLSVLDEGTGISEADLPHVFEIFHRGAAAPPGGTGLGLAIVDGFVRAHGGTVSAANRQPRGAEFVMRIPVETLRPDVLEDLV